MDGTNKEYITIKNMFHPCDSIQLNKNSFFRYLHLEVFWASFNVIAYCISRLNGPKDDDVINVIKSPWIIESFSICVDHLDFLRVALLRVNHYIWNDLLELENFKEFDGPNRKAPLSHPPLLPCRILRIYWEFDFSSAAYHRSEDTWNRRANRWRTCEIDIWSCYACRFRTRVLGISIQEMRMNV